MRILSVTTAFALLLATIAPPSRAADNELTPDEKAAGWQLLFNGTDHTGWKCNNGKAIASPIEESCLVPAKSGGYLIIYENEQFGDFILKCKVKMGERCNSGIFLRVGDPKDAVQTGLEMQISSGKGSGYHDFGGIYDIARPTRNKSNGPGKWDEIMIICQGPKISIAVNGETVTTLNCDEFTEPYKRPDGSRHKFRTAIKDFPRNGYIGFQDHQDGTKCWFKDVKIRKLAGAEK